MTGCDNSSMHVIAMATGTIAQTIQINRGMVCTHLALVSDSLFRHKYTSKELYKIFYFFDIYVYTICHYKYTFNVIKD